MSIQEQLDEALRSERPIWRLRDVVQSLLAQGQEREAVVAELEHFRCFLHAMGRDEDEDIVLEVMDFLVGWSSPHMKL